MPKMPPRRTTLGRCDPRRRPMSAQIRPSAPAISLPSRRSFVGGVGAVMLGCASDDGNAKVPQQGSPLEPQNGTGDTAASETSATAQPMGAAAESGDEAPQ